MKNTLINSKESGNEILTICLGKCGVLTGYEFLSTIMNEHGIDNDGKFMGDDKIVLNKIDAYFKNDTNNNDRYIPRFMFIDIDSSPINMVKRSRMKSLFEDSNMIDSGFQIHPLHIHKVIIFLDMI